MRLKSELGSRAYAPGRSICFVVTEPKPREIFAADFRDRVVHHVLVNYLERIWEPKFIGQSFACRQHKGAHDAIKVLKKYIGRASRGGTRQVYYLQLDIKSFFVSLKKDILFELIKKYVKDPEVLWLAKKIIFHDPTANYCRKCQMSLFDLIPEHKSLFKMAPDYGLPIGNLTSQFFANVYLNELDRFVKHKLKAKYYLRYVDDFLLLSEDRERLKFWRDEIKRFLRKSLELELHSKKQIIQDVAKGINFVGFIVKLTHVLVRRRIVKNLKAKLWNLNKFPERLNEFEIKRYLSVVNSYYGQFKHARTFNLRGKLLENHFGILGKSLKPVDKNLSYFKINNAKSLQA